jgi:hypothetical protein
MDESNRKRLEWVANAKAGQDFPRDLFESEEAPGSWAAAMSAMAQAALDEIADQERSFDLRHSADMLAIARWRQAASGRELKQPDHTDLCVWLLDQLYDRWRPVAEAPIPEPQEGFIFICLLQTERGIVGEGCARYVRLRSRGSKTGEFVLRWYLGYGGRETRVCEDPKYFMPLPQPRKDP